MLKFCNVVVLIFGFGSNLQVLIDSFWDGVMLVWICVVIFNCVDVYGLECVCQVGIQIEVFDYKVYVDCESFDQVLV